MTITLELPPELESPVRGRSKSARTVRRRSREGVPVPRRAGARRNAPKRCRRQRGIRRGRGYLDLRPDVFRSLTKHSAETASTLARTTGTVSGRSRRHERYPACAPSQPPSAPRGTRSDHSTQQGRESNLRRFAESGRGVGSFAHGHSKTTASASRRIKRTEFLPASRVPFFDSETPTRSIRSGVAWS